MEGNVVGRDHRIASDFHSGSDISDLRGIKKAKSPEESAIKSLESLLKIIDKKVDDRSFKTIYKAEELRLLNLPTMTPDTASIFVMTYLDEKDEKSAKSIQQSLVQSEESVISIRKARDEATEKQHAEAKKREIEAQKQQTSADVGLGFSTASFLLGLLIASMTILNILSGGALSPLQAVVIGCAIAGAVVGAASTSVDIANRVLQSDPNATEKDPFGNERKKQITFGRLFKQAEEAKYTPEKVAKMTEEEKAAAIRDLDKKETDMNTAMTVVMILFTIATSLPSLVSGLSAGLSKLAKVVTEVKNFADKLKEVVKAATVAGKLGEQAKTLSTVADIADFSVDVCNSFCDVATSGYGLNIAYTNYKIAQNEAKAKLHDAISNFIDQNIDLLEEHLKNIYDSKSSNLNFAKSINSNFWQSQDNLKAIV